MPVVYEGTGPSVLTCSHTYAPIILRNQL